MYGSFHFLFPINLIYTTIDFNFHKPSNRPDLIKMKPFEESFISSYPNLNKTINFYLT